MLVNTLFWKFLSYKTHVLFFVRLLIFILKYMLSTTVTMVPSINTQKAVYFKNWILKLKTMYFFLCMYPSFKSRLLHLFLGCALTPLSFERGGLYIHKLYTTYRQILYKNIINSGVSRTMYYCTDIIYNKI